MTANYILFAFEKDDALYFGESSGQKYLFPKFLYNTLKTNLPTTSTFFLRLGSRQNDSSRFWLCEKDGQSFID